MKSKNLYYAVALCAGAAVVAPANAQDVFVDDAVTVTEFSCDNKTHYFNNWNDNWFIQLGAGVNQPIVERGTKGGALIQKDKITTTYNFGVGRWVSPYFGFRINALGGALHWDTPTAAQPNMGWSKAKHANLNAEVMWDMFNSIGGVNSKRVFSIIPFVGVGGDAMWDFKNAAGYAPVAGNVYNENGVQKVVSWTLPVTTGLQFRFNLGKYVDFFAEARAAFYGDNWNNNAKDHSIDANAAVLGGFSFKLGGRDYKSFNECNYVSQIAGLNGQVNDLRAQLLAAGAQVAALAAQLPCPEVQEQVTVEAPLMTTVRFMINSAEIMPTEEVNVYNMAQYLNANPGQNVVICGYADKDTGTAEYNMELSQKRAQAVANSLIKNYGIDANRLTVKYDGSQTQPYQNNDWNRIVIFTQAQ